MACGDREAQGSLEPDSDDSRPTRRCSRWRLALTVAVLLGALGYLAAALYRQWEELGSYHWTVSCGRCLASLTLAGGWFAIRGLLWQRVLSSFGHTLRYRDAFRMWALSELGRYLPGKAWYALGRGYLAARHGIVAPVALASMVLELFVVVLGALVLVGARSGMATGAAWAPSALWLLVPAAAAAVCHPRAVRALFRVLRQAPPPQFPRASQLGGLLFIGIALWSVMGVSFAVFVSSLCPLPVELWPETMAAYALAWVGGLLSLVSPGGLGVRESLLAVALGCVVPPGTAVAVALASRLWITLAEGAAAVVALCLRPGAEGGVARPPDARP